MAFAWCLEVGTLLPPGRAGDRALAVWLACGRAVDAHPPRFGAAASFVPLDLAQALGDDQSTGLLVSVGLWTDLTDGFHMEYGPGSTLSRPLWQREQRDPRPRSGQRHLPAESPQHPAAGLW